MTTLSLSCPLCGWAFEPAAHAGCARCPLSAGCRMLCCPNCGHTTVDPRGSRLARWVAGALGRLRQPPQAPSWANSAAGPRPLTAAPRGMLRVTAVRDRRGDIRARLRAYGIVAGASLELIQRRPATVIRIEHTELALEAAVAASVLVEPVSAH